jgi:hypothetical protein
MKTFSVLLNNSEVLVCADSQLEITKSFKNQALLLNIVLTIKLNIAIPRATIYTKAFERVYFSSQVLQ